MRATFQKLMEEHGIDAGQVPARRGLAAVAYEDILYEVGGGRATITINRPERLNAFRGQTMLELCEAFERSADDEARRGDRVHRRRRARLLRGRRRARAHPHDGARSARATSSARAWRAAMRNNGKPIICRVRGYCIGGGNELNMVSDLTITDTTGRFGQAGPKIGSAPLWWGCQLIPAVVGEKKAREILFLTRQYTAQEALAMGLVNAVVEPEELDAEVDRWCDRDPAPLAPGAAPGEDRAERRHRRPLLVHQPRDGADGAEPRLRPRARRRGSRASRRSGPADWRRFREGQGPEPEAADDGRVERLVRPRGPHHAGCCPEILRAGRPSTRTAST